MTYRKASRGREDRIAVEIKRLTLRAKAAWHRLCRHRSPLGFCSECRESGLDWSRFIGRDSLGVPYFDLSVMYCIKLGREDLIPESGHFGISRDGLNPIPEELYDQIDW